eukprot:CAMPEP_0114262438 /NCGR_PEP_ID=MMETSP0058-20121206/21805_1 /TAXON_ID=36894 /ORGANISM="Pyramimonas parkeae, CCMP726" /LENGTH=485 /DNA_ID=CAMNT_0001378309 /DNA_START=319 /DNA_END=1776 /DNA_ORIENTATION=-
MTRKKEVFAAREGQGNKVGMYVCGVTVYDFSHIGHARAYVAFDVLLRYLQSQGYDVTYCRNFTDVDDKIIKRAAENGEDPLALTQRFIAEFHTDMALLNCLPPSVEPKVTENIEQIVAMIGTIVANGHAYAAQGDVYFHVPSLEGYGQLSGRKMDDNRAGERVAVDSRKKNSADFALWKAAKEGELSWPSPWGPGRPGWHIECSAMSERILGPVIDIHGGGADLVFPHHENELAQSKAACSHSHVRYWMHNGFVTVEEEKMSKSLGNFFTIRDVLQRYHPMALRWLLLGTHYRAPINYSKRGLEEASDRVYYLYQAMMDAECIVDAASEADRQPSQDVPEAETARATARAAMADDLNTPQATGSISAPLKVMNDLMNTKKGRKTKDRAARLATLLGTLRETIDLMGLPVGDGAAQRVLQELRQTALTRAEMTEEDIALKVEARKEARAAKDYEAADKVRVELEGKGIVLMDTPEGTTWRPSPVLE